DARASRGELLAETQLAGADFEHPSATYGTGAFGCWPSILHRDRLGIRDFARGLAFMEYPVMVAVDLGVAAAFALGVSIQESYLSAIAAGRVQLPGRADIL